MGNRGVITTEENFEKNGVGVYLHWNGGRDSVEAFLAYCDLKGHRQPELDGYGWARLCQVIGNTFGGTLSVGMDNVKSLDCDNWDNGTYLIKDWKIVGRKYHERGEQNSHDFREFMHHINDHQPESERIPKEEIDKYCETRLAEQSEVEEHE